MKSAVMLFADHPLPVLQGLEAGQEPDPLALALLRDTLRTLADVAADVFVFLAPSMDKEQAKALLDPHGVGGFKLASSLGKSLQARRRNAFRLLFSRGYEKALLLANALPDLPSHAVQTALDSLGWKRCCLGPIPGPDGEPDGVYAMGFDFEGYTTDALDMVDPDKPKLFGRMETLLLFYERTVTVLAPHSPVDGPEAVPALVARCRDTRFTLLPSLRLASRQSQTGA
ncbi:hypothetical protein SAMN04488503_0520 [Humidesulfovibrio mexicanus]|uniref:Uncharacterized protein n=1 Tax=Humidesulfovibrio mexicanus TaxID=147047 RepID=A0A238XZ73_9BACT|nr:DUF2064 domain-containing protein [Humidesulfovibrio mexicanus]SNR63723.1 hypothetical protein SAMN04488503_0520 [Humidesulfovibrio mexicanus]